MKIQGFDMTEIKEEYKFFKKKIKLKLSSKVFRPNLTTFSLIESIHKIKIKKKLDILDLGCGSGIIGIFLKKFYKNNVNIFMSDYSDHATNLTKINSKINKVKIVVVKSNIFEKWKGKKFDIIIDDISAIDQTIAKKSPWYNKFIPSNCGRDGIFLTEKVIKESKKYLKKNGKIFIPCISLSDYKKVITLMKRNFRKVKLESYKEWPISKQLYQKIKKSLKKNYILKKYGINLCFTSIYSGTQSK